jgi:hypothetical protein
MDWTEKLLVAVPWITGGLAGAVLTLLARIISEKRRQKRIELSIEKKAYALPPLAQIVNEAYHELKVTYNDTTYEHLFSYSVVAKNIGYGSVSPYSLVIVMSKDAKVLATFSRVEPVYHEIETAVKQSALNLEHTFKLPRLEKGDTATISLLVDSPDSQLRCFPRDADGVAFVTSSQRESTLQSLVLGAFTAVSLVIVSIITPYAQLDSKYLIIILPLLLGTYLILAFFSHGRSRSYEA